MSKFSLDQKTAISHAFDRGNYADAYGEDDTDTMSEIERAAYLLGFYASCELHEIGDRAAFDAAYWSDVGTYVVNVAGYCDNRVADYATENEES